MSDRFVVEVHKRTVGIAVRAKGGFRFFASEPAYFALEGRLYPDLRAAMAAAETLGECRDAGKEPRQDGKGRAAGACEPKSERKAEPPDAAEEPPEWFRWAILLGMAGSSALAGAVLASPAQ